jgi:hypothetical protein
MRLRQNSLKTGKILTCFTGKDGSRNASVLFLVSGARDIEPLRRLDEALRPELDRSFQWTAVANALDLARIDPRLDPKRVTWLEVEEFRDLQPADILQVLSPVLTQLRLGEAVCFPNAARIEGSVARGPDCLERSEELTELRARVERKEHTLVLAPRRSGKTTLLVKLAEELGQSFRVEFVDTEQHRSPDALTADLRTRVTGRPHTAALREVREQGWEVALPETLRALARDRKRPLVLVLDELVFFLDNVKKHELAHTFLSRLDAAVQAEKAAVLVAGSVDLRPFARNTLKLTLPGLFGALATFRLPPLASRMLEVQLRRVLLGTGLVLEPGDMEWLHENLDLAMPYPALRFLSHLASVLREKPLKPADLEAELVSYVRTSSAFAEVESHLNRLAEDKPEQAERVERVLDRLARAGTLRMDDVKATLGGTRAADTFEWLMTHFPLELEGTELKLASRLFRRYWQERSK